MPTSRRALLRSVAGAVVAVAPSAAGTASRNRSAVESNALDETSAMDAQSGCEPRDDGDYPAVDGFVFHPASYRECAPFRIRAVTRTFRTSVGPGPSACHRERREYLAYGIAYANVELGPDEGVDGGANPAIDGGVSTFLAVRTPGDGDRALPHDYFRPDQLFQFVSAGDEVVFHARCSEPTTPMQKVRFAAVY